MIAPTLCAWCNQSFGKGIPIMPIVPGDNEMRLFHQGCWIEIVDEIFARENESIFRRKD